MLRINTNYYRISEDLKLEELKYVGKYGNKYIFHDQYLAEVRLALHSAEQLNLSRVMVLNDLEEMLRYRINLVHDQLTRHKIKFNPINGVDSVVISRAVGLVEVHKYHLNGSYINSYPSTMSAYQAVTGNDGNNGVICAVCKGKRRTAYGYRWSYIKFNKLPKLPKLTRAQPVKRQS